jgi:acyl-coenzyme A synthetase/AMP-(fatty) acid ligase
MRPDRTTRRQSGLAGDAPRPICYAPMPGPFESRRRATLARFGSARAIVCAATGRSLTFDELELAATARASAPEFRKLSGRVVLLHLPNSTEWLVAFLALRLAGAIIVPVDVDTPPAGVADLRERLGAAGVLDTTGFRPADSRAARRSRDLFLGKLTSGSTGTPKAYFFTESQMIADGDISCVGMDIRPDDLSHAGIPFGHAYALGSLIMPLFTHGVPMLVAASHFPQIIATEIERYRATVMPTVPSIIAALHRSDIASERFASLRKIISAGARLDPADARAFEHKFSRRVHNLYGSSETGAVAFDVTGDDTLTGESAGRLLPGVSASRMHDGRLLVSGPAVRTHGNTRRAGGFGAQPMADIGHIMDDGRIRIEGRFASLVKIGGRRINPGEVVNALQAIPGVSEAFVTTIPGVGADPRLAALIAGDMKDAAALRATLRKTLPPWKVPGRIVILTRLPVTGRGKPDRAAMTRILEEA